MGIELFTAEDHVVLQAHVGDRALTDDLLARFLASAIEQAAHRHAAHVATWQRAKREADNDAEIYQRALADYPDQLLAHDAALVAYAVDLDAYKAAARQWVEAGRTGAPPVPPVAPVAPDAPSEPRPAPPEPVAPSDVDALDAFMAEMGAALARETDAPPPAAAPLPDTLARLVPQTIEQAERRDYLRGRLQELTARLVDTTQSFLPLTPAEIIEQQELERYRGWFS